MDSDMSKAKNLFNGNNSYAYRVSAQASMINYAADNEMNRGYSCTAAGTYGVDCNNGIYHMSDGRSAIKCVHEYNSSRKKVP